MTEVGHWSWLPVRVLGGGLWLRPAAAATDAGMLCDWLNAPHVWRFWRLHVDRDRSGTYRQDTVESYLRQVQASDGETGLIGASDTGPMSYWEVYDVTASPLADLPDLDGADRGMHVLVGESDHVGQGVGPPLIRAVADWQFDQHSSCGRVVVEPDIENPRGVKAFERAGFRRVRTVALEHKHAALMVLDRDC